MPIPAIDDWEKIAQEFGLRWNFPLSLGAPDKIKAPAKSGSLFFDYKKTHSIVLLAAADAKDRCVLCNVGAYGRQSDGGVFRNSGFGEALATGALVIPKRGKLPNSDIEFPFVFVADEAFGSNKYRLRPFPGNVNYEQRVFNYRLARARRIVENLFGIPVARFRIFRSPIEMKPQNVDTAILAALVLHNFLMTKNETDNSDFSYAPLGFADVEKDDGSFTPGEWRETVNLDNSALSGGRFVGNRSAYNALEIRDEFMRYFLNEGKIPWQHAAVTKGSS